MTPNLFHALLQELIDENPFAIRAALRILKVEFTPEVPTLAVTCEARPRLKVNLDFLAKHAKSEAHVKAVVCHEFLHVLLRHTEGHQPLTPARHLAFDAVINAIIHRQFGESYSSMMSDYYRVSGVNYLGRSATIILAGEPHCSLGAESPMFWCGRGCPWWGRAREGARRYRLPRQGWVSGQQKPPWRVGCANASFWAVGKKSRKGDARA